MNATFLLVLVALLTPTNDEPYYIQVIDQKRGTQAIGMCANPQPDCFDIVPVPFQSHLTLSLTNEVGRPFCDIFDQ